MELNGPFRDRTSIPEPTLTSIALQWVTSDQARYTGLAAVIGVIIPVTIPVLSKNKYTLGLGGLAGGIAGYLLFDSINTIVEKVDDFSPLAYVISIPSRIASWFISGLRTTLQDLFSFLPGVSLPSVDNPGKTRALERSAAYQSAVTYARENDSEIPTRTR